MSIIVCLEGWIDYERISVLRKSFGSQEISWASEMDFPMTPSFLWRKDTFLLCSVLGWTTVYEDTYWRAKKKLFRNLRSRKCERWRILMLGSVNRRRVFWLMLLCPSRASANSIVQMGRGGGAALTPWQNLKMYWSKLLNVFVSIESCVRKQHCPNGERGWGQGASLDSYPWVEQNQNLNFVKGPKSLFLP